VEPIIWVGLDVHKNSTIAAVLIGDEEKPQVLRLTPDLNELRRLFRKLAKRGPVRSCYEASGAGFVVHRVLEHDGFSCEVIAPSLIPSRPGDRRKTDRRDAENLVRLYRSGLLTPVQVPSEEQEAVRDLVRTHVARTKQITMTKQRIHGLLARQRRELTGPVATVLVSELEVLEYLETQLNTIDAEIENLAQRPPYRQPVEALTCLRGVKTFTAMTILTEIGDIRRFASARALMAWTGLVPSEASSGDRHHRGPITKTGNTFLRRALVETAHNHRTRAGSTLILDRRRAGKPPEIVSIALKAQHRLCRRYWRLAARKHTNIAVTAVARELAGFVWALLNAVPTAT
jgi:transposase